MRPLPAAAMQRNGWRVCSVYVLDSHFVTDSAKFIAGSMQASTRLEYCPSNWGDVIQSGRDGAMQTRRGGRSTPEQPDGVGQTGVPLRDGLAPRAWPIFVALVPLFAPDALDAGALPGPPQALSAMVLLEIPHVNLLTKMDLCPNRADIERFLFPDGRQLAEDLTDSMGPRFKRLNEAVSAEQPWIAVAAPPVAPSRCPCRWPWPPATRCSPTLPAGFNTDPSAADLPPPRFS